MKRALLLLLLCAACGKRGVLEARPGHVARPLPYAVNTAPTPDQQLTRATQAAPRRVDDPLTRSEERQPDKFDLPPKR